MPVGIVEVGEIVRVADVLGGEAGLQPASELDDFVRLERLELAQLVEKGVEKGETRILGHGGRILSRSSLHVECRGAPLRAC